MHGGIDEIVVIALGGNLPGELGSPVANMEAALMQFEGEGLHLIKRSSWWKSSAWPDPSEPDYINAVVLVETNLSPDEVLATLGRIEDRLGRVRSRRNAPRTVDLDLIANGRRIIDQPDLVVPHPRAAERRFVMGPLAEIAADWRHPASDLTARELAASATIGTDSHPMSPNRSG